MFFFNNKPVHSIDFSNSIYHRVSTFKKNLFWDFVNPEFERIALNNQQTPEKIYCHPEHRKMIFEKARESKKEIHDQVELNLFNYNIKSSMNVLYRPEHNCFFIASTLDFPNIYSNYKIKYNRRFNAIIVIYQLPLSKAVILKSVTEINRLVHQLKSPGVIFKVKNPEHMGYFQKNEMDLFIPNTKEFSGLYSKNAVIVRVADISVYLKIENIVHKKTGIATHYAPTVSSALQIIKAIKSNRRPVCLC